MNESFTSSFSDKKMKFHSIRLPEFW